MGLSAIEQGRRKIDESALDLILNRFDISKEELVKGEQE